MLLNILQHPHLTPSAASALLPLAVMLSWHLGRLAGDADATRTAQELSESLGFTLPAVTDTRSGRKDESHEKDSSSKLEKVAQLRQQAWRLLFGFGCEEEPLVMMCHGAGARLSVQDVVAQLKVGLCQP